MTELKIHPVSMLFPAMTDEEFAELKKDIEKHGVRLPVLTYQGYVIDGRHRYRACRELGRECPIQEWVPQNGESLVEFVSSLNFPRRSLTQSQRAAVAAAMVPMLEQEAKARRKAGEAGEGRSRDKAAKIVGVSPRYVGEAKAIAEKSPEAFEKVKAGELSISAARAELEQGAPEPVKDGLGNTITDKELCAIYGEGREQFNALVRDLQAINRRIGELAGSPLGAFIVAQQVEAHVTLAWRAIKAAAPHTLCPYCKARQKDGCRACRGLGWVNQQGYDGAPADLKAKESA